MRTHASEVTVAFVDVVGFTRLCEEAPPERIDRIVAWLERTAANLAPIELVKTVGDAVLLAGPRPGPVVAATVEIMRAAARDPEAPPLHAGIASGRAISRRGDWFGRPVNLANQLSGSAPAGTAEAPAPVAEGTPEWPWVRVGPADRHGQDAPIELFRLTA